tara:strand:- start:349 stop:606 length:258 start_codon:yes stop_codon:yes gene_type:complete
MVEVRNAITGKPLLSMEPLTSGIAFLYIKNMDNIRIETRTIKKVLYRIDPEAPKDEEFIEHINMLLLLMEQEQQKRDRRNGRKKN